MNLNEVLDKKKQNLSFTRDEIDFIVNSYKESLISEEKMVEFMENINENNFSYEETYFLADALAKTGEVLDIKKDVDFVIDKHSAGNISDPTTLIFMAVMATLGVKNVKVLSNSYGDFGSSLQRFKFFKGFHANITRNELVKIINKIGFGVLEETNQIAPVDKDLYKLRKKHKITSIPLIAASILAKKLATGVNAIIFDIKTGEGAIYASESFSITLAKYLVETSKIAGMQSVGVVTNLDQTLGSSIGPREELEEAINILRCERSLFGSKLLDVARELVIVALMLTKKASGRSEASTMFDNAINSGAALDKFRELILHYGGEYEDYKHSAQRLLSGVAVSYITAQESGYVSDVVLENLINSYKHLSRGNGDYYDANAGVVMLVREGTKINKGEKLMRIFYSIDNNYFCSSINQFKQAVVISKTKPTTHKVFYKVII